jgi:hypothetical protein
MHEVLKWAGLVGAIWFAVSIPTALILGRVLRGRSTSYPEASTLHLVSDERYAQQAGEQR